MKIDDLITKIARELTIELGEEGFKYHYHSLEDSYSPSLDLPDDLPKMIDHTLLRPDATFNQIERLCAEAKDYGFASVCVNPGYVHLANRLLGESEVKVCTVIGFPLGATTFLTKSEEAKEAIKNGAVELDMVINLGALKSSFYNLVYQDIKAVVEAASYQALTKVIIETCLLTAEEKIQACLLSKFAGADFVKTSTGFGSRGATPEDVSLMRKIVGPKIGVKASGGIRDYATAELMIKAGADRLGTSSGIQIITGVPSN